MQGKLKFQQDYPQIEQNINDDLGLSKKLKQEFYDHLDSWDGIEKFDDHLNSYFYSNKLCGQQEVASATDVFGRIVVRSAFIDIISTQTGLTRTDSANLVDEFISNPAFDLDIMKSILGNILTNILPRIVWSFRNPDAKSNPFQNLDLPTLPCQLGIEEDGDIFVGFSHTPQNTVDIHSPTALDGGIDENWRPGGLTQPLSKCVNEVDKGLSEFVHKPNSISDMKTKIIEIVPT